MQTKQRWKIKKNKNEILQNVKAMLMKESERIYYIYYTNDIP